MIVLRRPLYVESLLAIEAYVAQDNPLAAIELWLTIEEQVDKLADPNFPRRLGRVAGTLELVAHPSYVVILTQDADTVLIQDVLHTSRRYPGKTKA